jgi:Clostridium P-47 protein
MDIYGWDVVCACSSTKLNEMLALQFSKNPATLAYTDNGGTQINIIFDAWRIIAGGSVKKLRFELPVKTGSLTSPLGSVKLDGVVIVAEMELAFVAGVTPSTSNLQFSLQVVASQQGDPTAGSIFIINADRDAILTKQDPTGNASMTLHDIVPQCLIANKSKVAYVLSTLNLTPAGDGSWLAPQNSQYVFVQGSSGSSGYLAIFSMITNASTAGLTLNIDPTLCDGINDVCVAFAPHVFLEHVIMPSLWSSYVGANTANFQMQNGIIINFGPLMCKPVSHWGTGYQPVLTSFSMTIVASDLVTAANGVFGLTGLTNSNVTFSETGNMSVGFDASSGKLTITQDGTPTSDYEKHIPAWIYVLSAPAIVVLGPIIPLIVAGIVDGIIAGVTSSVAQSVSTSGQNLALSDWSAQSFQFPGFSKFAVQNAGLSESFYMRCKLQV